MEMVLQQSQVRWSSSSSISNASAAARPVTPTKKDAAAGEDELRRGPWTVDEDLTLINYIAEHGDGRWNSLARAAGLKRTGKSCRLRWLNYLRPDVKRGDFTTDEQLLILDLHFRWGNRWSKIAAHLPGRTDNEIKNYWRTRVQKHAKRLNCDASSTHFKDAIAASLWVPPRLLTQRDTITATAAGSPSCAVSALSFENNYYSSPSSVVTTTTLATPRPSSAATSTSSLASSSSCNLSMAPHKEKPYSGAFSRAHGSEMVSCGDWWTAQGADQDSIWSSTAPAATMQQLNAVDNKFQGFSEGISDNNLWSLEDIWRMQ